MAVQGTPAQGLMGQGRPRGGPAGLLTQGGCRGQCCWVPRVHASGHMASVLPALSSQPCPCPQARDVYEEAIRTVMTVRDFTQVFDSYAQFEESMIAAKMETASELGREEEGEPPGSLGWCGGAAQVARGGPEPWCLGGSQASREGAEWAVRLGPWRGAGSWDIAQAWGARWQGGRPGRMAEVVQEGLGQSLAGKAG